MKCRLAKKGEALGLSAGWGHLLLLFKWILSWVWGGTDPHITYHLFQGRDHQPHFIDGDGRRLREVRALLSS